MKSLLLMMFMFVTLSVHANVLNGKDFLAMCGFDAEQASDTYGDKCTSYVSGVYEAYVSFNSWELIADTLCPPANTSAAEMTGNAVAFIAKQAKHDEQQASALVLNALADIYPCK